MDPLLIGGLIVGGVYLLNRIPRSADLPGAAGLSWAQLRLISDYQSVVPGTQPHGSARLDALGGWEKYCQELDRRFVTRKALLDRVWTTEALQHATVQAAQRVGLTPQGAQVLWGIVRHESGGKPVGLTGGSAAAAIRLNSSAYGLCQVTGATFDDLADSLPWQHGDLWHPVLSLMTGGVFLRELLQRYPLDQAMRRYAGEDNDLYDYVLAHGPELDVAGLSGLAGLGDGPTRLRMLPPG